MKTIKTVLRMAALVAVMAFAVGCQNGEGLKLEDGDINLEFVQLDSGAKILQGHLNNSTGKDIGNAQIQVSLYDANNRRVESMLIAIKDIPNGESVEFREPIDSEFDIRAAKIRQVLAI